MRGYRSLCSEQDLLLVVLCSGAPGRAPSYGWDRMGGQLVVVGQTLLVDSLEILGQLGVPALGRLYAGAALCILVPSLPVVPLADVPRLPSEGAGSKGHLEVLAVGSQHASRVLRESHRIDDGDVLPRVRRITEEPVKILISGLLQRKVGPHLVQRHQHVLRVPHDKGVDEPRSELGTQQLFDVVSHVLEKDALLARPEDVLEHPLVAVLGLRLGVRKAVTQAVLSIIVRRRKRLVQNLEVVPLHKDPLERRRYRTGYSPQRNGFALRHMRLSLVHNRVSIPDSADPSAHDTEIFSNDMRVCYQAN